MFAYAQSIGEVRKGRTERPRVALRRDANSTIVLWLVTRLYATRRAIRMAARHCVLSYFREGNGRVVATMESQLSVMLVSAFVEMNPLERGIT
jgi:hypothetical protein